MPRVNYARVLAKFWTGGPKPETLPEHCFAILNEVNDHPDLVKQFGAQREEPDSLECSANSHIALGGATHDSAIAAQLTKGWYDYLRHVSAIRVMADRGQHPNRLAGH